MVFKILIDNNSGSTLIPATTPHGYHVKKTARPKTS